MFACSRARAVRGAAMAGLLALSAQPAFAQTPVFEGTIVRHDSAGSGRVSETRWLFRGGKMRIDSDSGSMIVDSRTRKITMVMPQIRGYMEIDSPAETGAAEAAPQVQRTGRRETIAGMSCEHWTVTEDDGDVSDVCVASGINVWPYFESFLGQDPKAAFIRSMARNGNFPLSEQEEGKESRDVVVSVSRTPPDAALFSAPAGYRRLTMEEYGREMMQLYQQQQNRRP